jgi:threonine aldolase
MRGFGSDNHSGVHPTMMKAIENCNSGHAPSYGTDSYSDSAIKSFRELFGAPVEVFFVFNGTAANVVSMRACAKSFNSVLVSDVSHLNVDECGAPEFMTGAKFISVQSRNGKISWSDIERNLIRLGDQHFSQPKVLSLSQPTELGTCYSVAELKELIALAHKNGLIVHIDGARIANAVVHHQTSFKEMITDTGVDILSFGGTKNGFLVGEAIVVLNEDLAIDLKYLRKQSCQLPSKTRFIASQFSAYLGSNSWREIAQHANKMAQHLRSSVENIPGVTVTTPTESNAVFATIPKQWIKPLREKHFFYVWNEHTFECRWMTSWDTTIADVDNFANSLKELSK